MAIGVVSFVVITQIRCPPLKFYGIHSANSESIIFSDLKCNVNQGCSSNEYQPICSLDGETHFFSPCQAGCQDCETKLIGEKKDKEITLYSKCSCVIANANETHASFAHNWPISWPKKPELPPATLKVTPPLHYAYSGYCPSKCQRQFFIILGVMVFVGFVLSANRLPSLLVFMRAVEARDKTTAFTFTVSFVSLFALIPSPIVFGALFDSTCIIWSKKCGEQLNCLAYDTDLLRVRVGSFSAILMFIAMCCEIGIFYYGKNLNIYESKDNQSKDIQKEDHTTVTSVTTSSTDMELAAC